MQVVVKGIVAAEDADLSVAHGAAAVIVSNHGGRAEESGRATIEGLPEVVNAVRGRVRFCWLGRSLPLGRWDSNGLRGAASVF